MSIRSDSHAQGAVPLRLDGRGRSMTWLIGGQGGGSPAPLPSPADLEPGVKAPLRRALRGLDPSAGYSQTPTSGNGGADKTLDSLDTTAPFIESVFNIRAGRGASLLGGPRLRGWRAGDGPH